MVSTVVPAEPAGQADGTEPAGQAGDNKPAGQAGDNKPAGQAGDNKPAGQAGDNKPAGQAGDKMTGAIVLRVHPPESEPATAIPEGLRIVLADATASVENFAAAGGSILEAGALGGVARFGHVPPGRYRLAIDDDRLVAGAWHELLVAPGTVSELGLELPPIAPSIHGFLLDERGKPAPVTELALYVDPGSIDPIARTTTARGDGAFRFARLASDRTYVLPVPGPSCVATASRLLTTDGSELRLLWSYGARVEILVRGKPRGSIVTTGEILLAPESLPIATAGSGPMAACLVRRTIRPGEGRITLDGLPAGAHRLAVRAPGFAPLATTITVPRDREPPGNVVMVMLDQESCYEISVASRLTGEPVPSATLAASEEVLEDPGAKRLAPPMLTDAAGSARFCAPFEEARELIADHPDFAPVRVALPAHPTVEPLRVALGAGGSAAGRVLGTELAPVEGARVSARRLGRTFQAHTDAAGRYRLDHLPPGEVELECSAEDRTPERRLKVTIREGRETRADFGGTGTIDLLIATDTGEPLADTPIVVRSEARGTLGHYDAITDSDGRATIPAIEGRGARVAIRIDDGWNVRPLPAGGANAERSDSQREATVTVPHDLRSIRVIDSGRRPVTGAAVVLSDRSGGIEERVSSASGARGAEEPPFWPAGGGAVATTGQDGRCAMRGLGAGQTLVVIRNGSVPATAREESPGSDLFVLEGGASVRVSVRDAPGPVSAGLVRGSERAFTRLVRLTPSAETGSGFGSRASAEIDADPGSYALLVWAEGSAPSLETALRIDAGAAHERAITLTEGGSLRIRFADEGQASLFPAPGELTSGALDWSWLLHGLTSFRIDARGEEGADVLIGMAPAAIFTVRCGGAIRTARVVEGQESLVDCRRPGP